MVSIILGIDPGLQHTGWGVVSFHNNHLKHIAHGIIKTDVKTSISIRLSEIYKQLSNIIEQYSPTNFAIEEVFVNMNPSSSLKLGMARGTAICCVSMFGHQISEYSPNKIKKTVVGVGHATKDQVSFMIQKLLNCGTVKLDAADALAIAVCHAHYMAFNNILDKK